MLKKINKSLLFIILTFAISFSIAGTFTILNGNLRSATGFTIAIVYMFIPSLCVLIVQKLIHKEKISKTTGISFKINRWFFIAWLITPLIGFLAFGISLLFPDVIYSPGMEGLIKRFSSLMTPEQIEQMKNSITTSPIHPFWIVLIQGMFAGITVNAIAGFGEELGWRGFLLRQFRKMSFLKASITIGLIWGLWHTPLILLGHNYPEHPRFGVLMMTVWCILLTPLFNYITIKSKSVIAASIMHGTLNGTAGIALILVSGGNDLIVGMTGLAGFIALLLFNIFLFIYDNYIVKDKITRSIIETHLSN